MRRYIAVAIVSALWAGVVVYHAQGSRISAERLRAESAERQADNARVDLDACRQASIRQNEAIAQAEKRALAAKEAMRQADEARDKAEDKAAKILRERTPENVDRCTAAREAFASELRKERGL